MIFSQHSSDYICRGNLFLQGMNTIHCLHPFQYIYLNNHPNSSRRIRPKYIISFYRAYTLIASGVETMFRTKNVRMLMNSFQLFSWFLLAIIWLRSAPSTSTFDFVRFSDCDWSNQYFNKNEWASSKKKRIIKAVCSLSVFSSKPFISYWFKWFPLDLTL